MVLIHGGNQRGGVTVLRSLSRQPCLYLRKFLERVFLEVTMLGQRRAWPMAALRVAALWAGYSRKVRRRGRDGGYLRKARARRSAWRVREKNAADAPATRTAPMA